MYLRNGGPKGPNNPDYSLHFLYFCAFVLLYFCYSNKPGNHVLLLQGLVLSKIQRKYKKSKTFPITLSMYVEPGEYFCTFSINGVQFVALRLLVPLIPSASM